MTTMPDQVQHAKGCGLHLIQTTGLTVMDSLAKALFWPGKNFSQIHAVFDSHPRCSFLNASKLILQLQGKIFILDASDEPLQFAQMPTIDKVKQSTRFV